MANIHKLRAWRFHKQGLDGTLACRRPAEILDRVGWARSVGGVNPYLTLFARGGIVRRAAEEAAAKLEILELPGRAGLHLHRAVFRFRAGAQGRAALRRGKEHGAQAGRDRRGDRQALRGGSRRSGTGSARSWPPYAKRLAARSAASARKALRKAFPPRSLSRLKSCRPPERSGASPSMADSTASATATRSGGRIRSHSASSRPKAAGRSSRAGTFAGSVPPHSPNFRRSPGLEPRPPRRRPSRACASNRLPRRAAFCCWQTSASGSKRFIA